LGQRPGRRRVDTRRRSLAGELQFTLLRQPHMDDAAFAHDAEWIARDLRALQALLEAPAD
jgi:hypothetical protein